MMSRYSKMLAAVLGAFLSAAASAGLGLSPWVTVAVVSVLAGLAVYAAPANT